jgi:hypothetical protein
MTAGKNLLRTLRTHHLLTALAGVVAVATAALVVGAGAPDASSSAAGVDSRPAELARSVPNDTVDGGSTPFSAHGVTASPTTRSSSGHSATATRTAGTTPTTTTSSTGASQGTTSSSDAATATTASGTSGRVQAAGAAAVPFERHATAASRSATRTKFGVSLDLAAGGGFSQNLKQQESRFGKLGVVRVFYPGLPASWSSRPELAQRSSVVSFKMDPNAVIRGTYDSRMRDWFKSAPRGVDVYWSYWHEPENDKVNAATYRAAWKHLSALSRSASNPRLHATLILMGYTTHKGSHRNWRDWYAGSDSIDVLGFDAYNSGNKKSKYTDPSVLFDPLVAVAKEAGKPWGIAETGSKLLNGDTGPQRAAWLRGVESYLSANGAVFGAYWDVRASGGNFKLTDSASIAAWRQAVNG